MKWHLTLHWKFYRNLVLLICGYMYLQTVLFVGTFNLFSLPLRLVAVVAFTAYCVWAGRRLWQANWSAWLPTAIRVNWICLVIAAFALIAVHSQGPLRWNEQPMNFDWYKHNVILYSIIEHPLEPQIQLNGEGVDLAYYYAIYLPGALIGWLSQTWLEPNDVLNLASLIFDARLLAGQLLALLLVPLVIRSLFPSAQKISTFGIGFLALAFFAQADGIDYLLRTGDWIYTSDIEWVFMSYYFPLRLQSILSYSYWVPGHLTATLLGLGLLISLRRLEILRRLPLVLIYLYTASSSLFAFIGLQLIIPVLLSSETPTALWTYIKQAWKQLLAAAVVSGLVLVLYLLDTLYTLVLLRSLTKLAILLGVAAMIWLIPAMRRFILRYWLHLSLLSVALLGGLMFVRQTHVFSLLPLSHYLIFFLKELGVWMLVVTILQVGLRQSQLPKIVVVALGYIVLMSLLGKPDFMFSGVIAGVFILAIYLGYLLEQAFTQRRWLTICVAVMVYLAGTGLSLASVYHETIATVAVGPKPFTERYTEFRDNWVGLFEIYTSEHTDDLRL